jgi:hypothetical protein
LGIVKICKAIKLVRKLAKTALAEATPPRVSDAVPPHASVSVHLPRQALKLVKALLVKFDDDLSARSETTSLRHVAAAIAGHESAMRLDPAGALEDVARLALSRGVETECASREEVVSAVTIVRALADDIRAARRLVMLRRTRRRPVVVRLRDLQHA